MARWIETGTCPYAFGFIPQESECRLRRDRDLASGVAWWRRLWRRLTGYYDCPFEGSDVSCARRREHT